MGTAIGLVPPGDPPPADERFQLSRPTRDISFENRSIAVPNKNVVAPPSEKELL